MIKLRSACPCEKACLSQMERELVCLNGDGRQLLYQGLHQLVCIGVSRQHEKTKHGTPIGGMPVVTHRRFHDAEEENRDN